MKISDTLPAVKGLFTQGLDKAKAKFSTLSAPDLSALKTKKAGAGVIAALVLGTLTVVGFRSKAADGKTSRWEQFKTGAKKAITAAKNKAVVLAKNPKAQKSAAVATLAVGAGIVAHKYATRKTPMSALEKRVRESLTEINQKDVKAELALAEHIVKQNPAMGEKFETSLSAFRQNAAHPEREGAILTGALKKIIMAKDPSADGIRAPAHGNLPISEEISQSIKNSLKALPTSIPTPTVE